MSLKVVTAAAKHSVKSGFIRALAIIFLVDIKKSPKYLQDLEDYYIDAEPLIKKIGIRPAIWQKLATDALKKKISDNTKYPPYWEVADQILEKSSTLKTELGEKQYLDFAVAWANWMSVADAKSKKRMLSLLHIADNGSEGLHVNKEEEDDSDMAVPSRKTKVKDITTKEAKDPKTPKEPVAPKGKNIPVIDVVPLEEPPSADPLAAKFAKFKGKQVSTAAALTFMAEGWREYNKTFFGGKMKMPMFDIIRATGSSFRLGGDYRRQTKGSDILRMIRLNKRIFTNGGYRSFYVIMLHEMCHQAAAEIDGVNDGHGNIWGGHMRNCGLEPSQYLDEELSLDLLGSGDKVSIDIRSQSRHQIHEDPKPGDRVKVVVKDYGLIRGEIRTAGSDYSNFTGDNGKSYKVPNHLIYKI